MPTILLPSTAAAAWVAVCLDEPIGARFGLVSDPSTAAWFAGTIAAATLAFVAVVFATTLVAIRAFAECLEPALC